MESKFATIKSSGGNCVRCLPNLAKQYRRATSITRQACLRRIKLICHESGTSWLPGASSTRRPSFRCCDEAALVQTAAHAPVLCMSKLGHNRVSGSAKLVDRRFTSFQGEILTLTVSRHIPGQKSSACLGQKADAGPPFVAAQGMATTKSTSGLSSTGRPCSACDFLRADDPAGLQLQHRSSDLRKLLAERGARFAIAAHSPGLKATPSHSGRLHHGG